MINLKLLEALLRPRAFRHFQDVEGNSFTEWSAFSNCNDVTDTHIPVKATTNYDSNRKTKVY